MKSKKILTLFLGLGAALSLASCGENPEEQLAAVNETLEAGVCYNGATFIYEGYTTEFDGDTNEALTATTKMLRNINGKVYTVEISYEFDTTLGTLTTVDDSHSKIMWKFPDPLSKEDQEKYEAATTKEDKYAIGDKKTQVTATAKCGRQSKSETYDLVLIHKTKYFDDMTLEQLYAKSEDGSTFAFMNGEKIGTNYGQDYFYLSVSGKVVYKSPDSNWGILSDGNYSVQVYQLGKCNDNDKFVEGKYVKVFADIAQYYGNIQLSYVSKIVELEDHSNIKEPVVYDITTSINDKNNKEEFKAFNSGISNSVATIKGVTVKSTSASNGFDGAGRYTFTIEQNGKEMTVAYDYHVKTSDGSVQNAYKDILSAVDGKTDKVNITGTLRWSGNGINANGEWQIVPFLANHIVRA